MQQHQQQDQHSRRAVNLPPPRPVNVHYVIPTQPPPQPPQQTVLHYFPKRQAVGLGITLLLAGSLSIILNIVAIAVANEKSNDTSYLFYYVYWVFGYIGHGFWVGIMCIIPGALGITAGIHKTKGRICAFNVMCILAASLTLFQFGIGLAGAIAGPSCSVWFDLRRQRRCIGIEDTEIAMEAMQTILAVIEAVAAIWGSTICCRTYCCCSCCEIVPTTTVQTTTTGTRLTVISGNQQVQTVQYPVMIPGYQHVGYQPGYPGQPIQYTTLPPAYSAQGHFIPVGQPPRYYEIHHSVQLDNPSAPDIQPDSNAHLHREPEVSIPQATADQPELQQYENFGFTK